jgi:SnoaL-like domain
MTTSKTDAVAVFCEAAQAKDFDRMVETLAPDAELISPLLASGAFRGRDDLRVLLGAVYGLLTGLHWQHFVGDGRIRVAVSEARIAGVAITDAMVVELNEAGQIQRIRPHLRPWSALTLFAVLMLPKLLRNPGVMRRALS